MKKQTRKSTKACVWTKTGIILARAIFFLLASGLALISVRGFGRI